MAADPTVSTPGKSSLAVGTGAVANGQQAVAVGNSAEARRHSVAVGQNSKAQGQASTALGAYSHALAYHTVAVGTQVTASKQGAIAVGRETVASANLSVAIGRQAKATDEHAVALGDNATTRAATQETDATVGPMTYGGFAGDKPIAVVSVGQADQERQLVNVGASNISATSTDAINGSQLYATNAILGNVATSTVNALGGGAVLNATTGEFEVAYNLTGTNPSTSEPTGTTYSSVGDALTALSTAVNQPITFKGDEGTTTQELGSTLNIVAGNATDTSTRNVKTNVTSAGQLEISFSDKPTFTDVTVEENLTVGPVTINATTGINAGNTTITNVANGTNGTDAVNLDQLNASTVANAWKITGNNDDANATTVGNQTVSFNNGTGTTAVVDGTNVTYNINTDGTTVKVGTDGNLTVVTGDLSTTDGKVALPTGDAGTSLVNQTTVMNAINQSGWKLAADGTAGTELINPSETVAFIAGTNLEVVRDGANITYKTAENVSFNNITTNNFTVNPDSTVNMGGNTVTNVAPGTNGTDAVNLDQLNKAKVAVLAGDNTVVTSAPNATTGGTDYTVHADKTVIEPATGSNITVTPTTTTNANGTETTTYSLDLDQATKDQIAKEESVSTGTPDLVSVTTNATKNATGGKAEGSTIQTIANDDTVTIKAGKNIKIAQDGSNVTVETKDEVDFTTVNSTTVNVGGDAGKTTLTTVPGGNYNSEGQKIDDTAVPALSVGGSQITNVANGAISPSSTDAINGSQLYAVQNNFNQQIGDVHNRIGDLDKNRKAGSASAMAAAGLPQAYREGQSGVVAALGQYEGETGIAVGFTSISDNGKWLFRGSYATNSQNENAGNLGIGYYW